jgi:hypothetical protein
MICIKMAAYLVFMVNFLSSPVAVQGTILGMGPNAYCFTIDNKIFHTPERYLNI